MGHNDPLTLHSHNAVARDLRGLGKYQESLDIAREVGMQFEAVGGRENTYWLRACEGFATALRKAGYHWEASQQREHVLQRYRDYLGDEHMFTLTAATNLINDRRAVGDLAGAEDLAHETYDRCRKSSSPDDLLLYAAQLNLASVLRAAGRREGRPPARRAGQERAHQDLRRPASVHAWRPTSTTPPTSPVCGRLGEAIQLGDETLAKCRRSLGDSHPDTLMAAANLSVDEAAAGDVASAEQRLARRPRRYEETLTWSIPRRMRQRNGSG